MADTNSICSLCHVTSAGFVCFCEFPLPLFCPSCHPKHCQPPLPHFKYPVSVQAHITRENFKQCQDWLLKLTHAQVDLRKGVEKLTEIEEELEKAFRGIEAKVEEMKGKYRAALRLLREELGTMAERAIEETTVKAFNPKGQYESLLGEWLRGSAESSSVEETRLYEMEVEIREIEGIFEVKMKPKWPSLPQFDTYIGKSPLFFSPPRVQKAALREEIDANVQTINIPEASNAQKEGLAPSLRYKPVKPDPRPTGRTTSCSDIRPGSKYHYSPPADSKPRQSDLSPAEHFNPFETSTTEVVILGQDTAHCRVCGAEFSPEDWEYHCPSACRCKRCLIEALTGTSSGSCKLCSREFPKEVVALVNKAARRCHVCGIAVETREMELAANCQICCKCVTPQYAPKLTTARRTKGFCRVCRDSFFPINEEYYREIKQKGLMSACCGCHVKEDQKLQCGHLVCKSHKSHLKNCRTCQTSVVQSPSRRK